MSLKGFDSELMFWDGVTTDLTTGTKNSTSIDLKAADIDEHDPGEILVQYWGMTSSGSATVTLEVHDSADNSTFAAITPIPIALGATAFDAALWADTLRISLPRFGLRRYIRLVSVIATAALTAKNWNAGLVK